MREFLNENTLFATVAMCAQETPSLLLIVEGDDDHLVLKTHTSTGLQIIPGTGGRDQVLRTAMLAHQRGLQRVRFLIDRDYDDYVESTKIALGNVLESARHDLFMDLVSADPMILQRVVDVHTASASRRGTEKSPRPVPPPADIVENAFRLASQLAAVRIVSARNGLGFDFRRFSFGALRVSEFNVSAIVNIVMVRCGYDEHGAIDVLAEALEAHSELAQYDEPPVGDHDLFSAMARVLKRFDVLVSSQTLQRAFIMGVTCTAVSNLPWFIELQDWCALYGLQGLTCEPGPAAA